jgi:Uma2 family endonuclease
MLPKENKNYTVEEYLLLEREAETKSEYFRGEIFAMAGASFRHNAIVANLIQTIGFKLKGKPCRVYPSDLRVKVNRNGLYTYPDVIVVCGKPELEDDKNDTLLNPKVIFEVLSETTEKYDRGKKFQLYRELDSLEEYILVSQEFQRVEKYSRDVSGFWKLQDCTPSYPLLAINPIECELSLSEIYENTDIPEL